MARQTGMDLGDGPTPEISAEDLDKVRPRKGGPKLKQEEADRKEAERLARDSRKLVASYVHRIERLKEEIAELNEDVKAIYQSASDGGYNTAALKRLVGERKRNRDEVEAENDQLDTYRLWIDQEEGRVPTGETAH